MTSTGTDYIAIAYCTQRLSEALRRCKAPLGDHSISDVSVVESGDNKKTVRFNLKLDTQQVTILQEADKLITTIEKQE